MKRNKIHRFTHLDPETVRVKKSNSAPKNKPNKETGDHTKKDLVMVTALIFIFIVGLIAFYFLDQNYSFIDKINL